ncbi:Inner membrane component of T3SS domain-containing protein [Amycolatopsis pretoriensis]|uniref:Inner membrane component of T3SS domain-containing protein n=1 Tax=Amycolatopsis pretoriensis TaxID=218821 RepID=A0A1H5Q6V7_9PSEU|nr:FHA domain-containing protein [Amycolatopsis pretoriensis]SEF21138.1 Inner membrane component of T3SS domain-containing protein [Amycolatopsis pretoriensis]
MEHQATIETVEGAVTRLEVRRGSWLVGRAPEADLKLYSDRVSPRHAWLRRDARGTWVSEAGSRAGTLVNGEPLAPGRARLLRDGDRVSLGPITTVYSDLRAAGDEPVFASVPAARSGAVALVAGPVLFVAGFGVGAARVLRHLDAGPEIGVGLLVAGLVLSALGLARARRRNARPRRPSAVHSGSDHSGR